MSGSRMFDDPIGAWLHETAPSRIPDRVLTATFEQTRRLRQSRVPRWRKSLLIRSRTGLASTAAAAVVIIVAASLGVGLLLNLPSPGASPTPNPSDGTPSPTAEPFVDLGIFEPVAGWVVYGDASGIWGDNPDGDDVRLAAEAGKPLGWSRNGTALLVQGEHVFVLHADGSQTQVTSDAVSGGRASISPDGSRVIFEDHAAGRAGLYGVDVGGGPAELLIKLENPEGVSFSPDGQHIAYMTGSGDNSHRVWAMDVDGSNSRLVLANEVTLGSVHVHGIAWSPMGNRIALGIEGSLYTVTPDGTSFSLEAPNVGRLQPFWSADGATLGTKGPWHPGHSLRSDVTPVTPRPTALPLDPAVQEVLDGFLAARLAGVGAEAYLLRPDDVVFGDAPLLYATAAGDRYERAEYRPVRGVEWPYELTAFRVRLLAGRDVVEQLLFLTRDGDRLALEYVPDGFGTELAPTLENGVPFRRRYVGFDGQVSLNVAHPWAFQYDGGPIRLIPEAALPTTDGGERNDWRDLLLIADPTRTGTGCPTTSDNLDAAALAASIRSDPGIDATEPVVVGSGDAAGVMIDLALRDGASGACDGFEGVTQLGLVQHADIGDGERMRLYLFDGPPGASMRILAIAMAVPPSRFETAVLANDPIDSLAFHVATN